MKPLQTGRSHLGIFPCAPQKPYLEKAYPATKAHIKCFKPPLTSGSTPLGPHLEKEVWRRGGGDICDSSTPTHPEVGKKVGFSPPPNLPPKGGLALQL